MKKATVGIVLFNPEVETINKNIELLKNSLIILYCLIILMMITVNCLKTMTMLYICQSARMPE